MAIRELIRMKSGRTVTVRAYVAEYLVVLGEADYIDIEHATASPPENAMIPKGRGRVRG